MVNFTAINMDSPSTLTDEAVWRDRSNNGPPTFLKNEDTASVLASEFAIDLTGIKKNCEVSMLKWVLSKNPIVTVRGHALDQMYSRCAAFSTVPMKDFVATQDFWASWLAKRSFSGGLVRYHRETEHRYRYDMLPIGKELGIIRVIINTEEPSAYIPTFMSATNNRYHLSDKARTYVTEITTRSQRQNDSPAPYEPCRITGQIELKENPQESS
jgi:hypothetical protein